MLRTAKIFLLIILTAVLPLKGIAETGHPPKLVVNIVVSQMRYDYLNRFGHNFSEKGFRMLCEQGINCTNARYDYMNTTNPAGLATIMSGSNPSIHGVISEQWVDYTTNETVRLIEDRNYFGVGCVETNGQFSPKKLVVSTFGDELKRHNPQARVISLAMEPESAIITGGVYADAAYWFDPFRGNFCTSTYYVDRLPNWVESYNGQRMVDNFNAREWAMYQVPSRYVYTEKSDIQNGDKVWTFSLNRLFRRNREEDYGKLRVTPMGVELLMSFAKQTIVYENLGKDDNPDVLNIVIDPFRFITESYGTESMETEDAVYRLDAAIADLIEYAEIQLGKENVLFIITSDHGSSDTYRDGDRRPGGLFNVLQFRVLMNGFLNAQFGTADWVVDYSNSCLYLNHRLVYEKGLSLADMQIKAATFALQFRGVAHTISGTALQSNYFSGGPLQKMQSGYYPKHSGDIMINLLPGWIEDTSGVVSSGGSMYEYDVHVPLMWYGGGLKAETIHNPVNMTDVAPTLSRILGISQPDAVTGTDIIPITSQFTN